MKILKTVLTILVFGILAVNAQKAQKFSYPAQKKFIPTELGKIYLGMPFNELAKQIDLSKAQVGDTSFDWFLLTIPFEKGNVTGLTVKIHGLTEQDKAKILRRETVAKKTEDGFEYEEESDYLETGKIPDKGFVYALYIDFKQDFDLKNFVLKTYGKNGEVRKTSDEYRHFDIQWTKKTADGLAWLIRSFHDGDERTLQLLGRIEGTEWGADGAEN